MSQRKSNELILLIVLLVTLSLLYAAGLRNGHAWGDDFSQYIAQARSIAEGTIGETLDASLFRYENSENKFIGPVLYPWGFPLLLSGVYSLFGFDILAMKLLTSLFFLFSLAAVFFLFRDRVSFTQNVLIVLLLGINPVLFEAKDDVLSDFPFMFFTFLTLILIQRSLIDRKPLIGALGDHALIGASMFLSYAMRANGIILLPTLVLVQMVESAGPFRLVRHWPARPLFCLIPYAVFLVLVLALSALLPCRSSYVDQLAGIGLSSIMKNVMLYGTLPAEFFTTAMGPINNALGKLLFLISLPALFLGLLRFTREQYLFLVFSTLFMALLILWPGIQGMRYIFPVLPFFLFFVFHGLNEAEAFLFPSLTRKRRMLRPAAAFGIVAATLFGAMAAGEAYHVSTHPEEVQDGPYTKDSSALFRHIADHTGKGDVVIFYKPRAMWLYTRRKAIRLSRVDDIMVSRAKYVACRRNDRLDRQLRKKKGIACMVFANDSFTLYTRMRASPVSIATHMEAPARKALKSPRPAAGLHGSSKKNSAHKKKKKASRKEAPKKDFLFFDFLL